MYPMAGDAGHGLEGPEAPWLGPWDLLMAELTFIPSPSVGRYYLVVWSPKGTYFQVCPL